MSDEFVEYMEDSFGVRMDMDGLRIGNEHSGDSENKRTGGSGGIVIYGRWICLISELELVNSDVGGGIGIGVAGVM
ncbi:Hypothetical predicted protein [Octopus vulgaris]|uniref:Uncharacterized protein n=1 Tax=Octopus vulgaris TaxID=6645 RepID=A0AA36AXT8_OCTVU|nr:Hypothetical predicted protein [Octopus vulgaris]